jgi:hypothetical protein
MKTLLAFLLLAFSVCAEEVKPLSAKFICATPWRFDHPDTKNVPLKFKPDGTMESKSWKGLWKQTGPRQITMTISHKRTSVLNFSEDGMTYTGTHFEGSPVSGRRVGDIPPDAR